MTVGTAFITAGARTAIGRYGGALAAVRPDDLAAGVLRALAARVPEVPPDEVDEVVLGCVNQAGEDNRNVARMALLLAGLPESVPGVTVNRLCASGLEAVAAAARMVTAGEADVVIAGGVESMSRAPYVLAKPATPFARTPEVHDTTIGWRFVNPRMAAGHGVDPMPRTAENVASECGVSRADQDAFALRSQRRAARARAAGRFDREIVVVEVAGRDGVTMVDRDEHPRDTSAEALARLRPIVTEDGTVTAGNSSGVNDGAAAVLVASERAVARYGLTPLARVRGAASAGVAPRVMGLGPVPSTRKLLARHGIDIGTVDVVELNEAFAAQALACLRELGLPDDAEHVNPNGGAIALGHPLGMSGARLALTAAVELAERDARRALCTMCVGVGQGVSVLLERAG
ncbi:acetyl-CoA C-acetyltransferase/acetyl-CoA acyltransferase [Amycolatopsis arida]|uniref:Acetyl-CoA C-acetyltransferase/acetyl-CoA acyltransferase n=1 Tax=Amycolatopsis arida TaxID=587909 RepID=A0A1I5SQQ6_9PSEU|nr:acetyl-CoA C-acetyltransferase/acetyl-CoA acyltransferase [Amycolatopsis arida]SFP73018.1 acetyl-CoA C-acetyltransferase/acetyl-CoA acyltransferase [Amycolatopsis arida]